MAKKPLEQPEFFWTELDAHMLTGTGLNLRPGSRIREWTTASLAARLSVTSASVNNWRSGRNYPQRDNLTTILKLFFGDKFYNSVQARKFVALYNSQSYSYLRIPDADDLEVDVNATQQIPAAFRFAVRNEKLDVLLIEPEMLDTETARDLLGELREKTNSLKDRLLSTQSDNHVFTSVDRLCDVLVGRVTDIRPGLILSRLRSLESIRDAYDSPEGREMTFPDFRAVVDDVWLSGQDLLASFPEIRRIERARLALEIERSPGSVEEIQLDLEKIHKSALANNVASSEAISALNENMDAITSTRNIEEKVDLIGDTVLTTRNFVSEAIRSIVTNSKSGVLGVWDATKGDLEIGAKQAARMLPPLAVIALLTSIAGPVAGIAALLRGDSFRSVSNAVSKVSEARRARSNNS